LRPALAGVVCASALIAAAAAGCRRADRNHDRAAVVAADAGRAAAGRPLDGVVDPWSWPRAAGASAREQAIEDIGPYEEAAGTGGPTTAVRSEEHTSELQS